VTWYFLLLLYLRHLPVASVARPEISDKIFINKYPAPAGLGTRDSPRFGLLAQPFRVAVQEFGGFFEVQCFHFAATSKLRVIGRQCPVRVC